MPEQHRVAVWRESPQQLLARRLALHQQRQFGSAARARAAARRLRQRAVTGEEHERAAAGGSISGSAARSRAAT